jgi:NADH-quinone oxidoreductase subunit J
MTLELAFFILFAVAALLSALSVVLQKNPIYSALSLVVVIASLGGLFLLLSAHFIAILQIVIYAGAIMTLFLFVIMMVDVHEDVQPSWKIQSKTALLILLFIAGMTIWSISGADPQVTKLAKDFSVKSLARQLFTTYVFPFEVISILIISSVIGALYIARKEEI